MYMLARAQSLSGRPHDALVMLLRLADRGYTTDAAVNEDFAAVRRLPQWPDLAARLGDLPPPAAAHAAPGEASPSRRPDPSSPSATPAPPAPSARAGRTGRTEWSGRSLDACSRDADRPRPPCRRGGAACAGAGNDPDRARPRSSLGPLRVRRAGSRKLVIVDERMHLVVDLVREASAGFYDIAAFEIDPWRGDLWVVSADEKAGATALHHVQMVSGRPLERLDLPNGLMPGRRRRGRHPRCHRLRARRGWPAVVLRCGRRSAPSPSPHGSISRRVEHRAGR